jgi:hypothetical protein
MASADATRNREVSSDRLSVFNDLPTVESGRAREYRR